MKQAIVLLLGIAVLGSGCATTQAAEKNQVRLEVAADGSLTLEGEQTTLAGLGRALKKHDIHNKSQVIIAADKGAETGHVVAVLDELKKLGHTNVSMVSQ